MEQGLIFSYFAQLHSWSFKKTVHRHPMDGGKIRLSKTESTDHYVNQWINSM